MKEETIASVRATIALLRAELAAAEAVSKQTRKSLGFRENLAVAIDSLEVLMRFLP